MLKGIQKIADAFASNKEYFKTRGYDVESDKGVLETLADRVTRYSDAFKSGGLLVDRDESIHRITVQDMMGTPDAPILFPKVLENIMKEPVEPLLVLDKLLPQIQFKMGQTITFPAIGALEAADMSEGSEYPEKRIQLGGGTMINPSVTKVGLAVKFTEETLRYSQFDIMAMHVRAANSALRRHKEKKGFNMILRLGVTVFDNRTPTNSLFGVTHGRAMDGTANGSLVADDIMDAQGQLISQGYNADTLLMHPLFWNMFMRDAVMRHLFLWGGGGSWFGGYNGQNSSLAPWANSSAGGLGVASGRTIIGPSGGTGRNPPSEPGGQTANNPSDLASYAQDINATPVIPNYFGMPLRIIVSPLMPYNPQTRVGDIVMFDSSRLGVMLVDEPVTTEEWTDPARDIRKVKFRERYGFHILDEAQAIVVFKNVRNVPNEVVLPAISTMATTTTLAAISPTTAISGV